MIMELTLALDFLCCGCEEPVSVTVQCKGPGLASKPTPDPAGDPRALPALWVDQSTAVRADRGGAVRQTLPNRPASAGTLAQLRVCFRQPLAALARKIDRLSRKRLGDRIEETNERPCHAGR